MIRIILILTLINFSFSLAQVAYQQTFGGLNSDISISFQYTSDCGKIFLGRSNSFGAGDEDFLVIKTDASGNIEWSKAYGGPLMDRSNSIDTLPGGYLITGHSLNFGGGNNYLIIKTDLLGNIIWAKSYGGSSNEEPHNRETIFYPDGSMLIGGMGQSFGAGAKEMLLVKFDSTGNMLWNKYYGTGTANEWGRDITRTSTDEILIVGTMDETSTTSKFALLKTDSNGNVKWGKTYNNAGAGRSAKVIEGNDGGYIIVGKVNDIGAGNNDVFLVKTDTSGNVLWSKTYGGSGSEWGYEIVSVPGGYIVSGSATSFGFGQADLFVFKTDDSGNLIWSKTYGGNAPEETPTKSRYKDGIVSIITSTQSFGNGNWDFYEVVIDTSV